MTKRELSKEELALVPSIALPIFNRFLQNKKQIYLVGGAVRSILLDQKPEDLDFTSNATPDEIMDILKEWETFCDNDFGTVGVVIPDGDSKEVVEITPFRTENDYDDFRRPSQIKFGVTLEEDVKRRDFTINSIVIGPEKEKLVLIDFYGGLTDLENRLIRAVGKPEERFREDALRMLRAVRFANTLDFQIEKGTFEALRKNVSLLDKISKERIREELMKILASPTPAKGIEILVETGLMAYILPEVLEGIDVWQNGHHTMDVYRHMIEALRECPSSDPVVRLATLLHDVGKPRTRRLRCKRCGGKLQSQDLIKKGDIVINNEYKCPKCGNIQNEHKSATFYGHEVVGARMTEEIAKRLKFSNKDREKMVTLVRWHMFSVDTMLSDSAIRRFIRRIGKNNINDMILLRIADRKGGRSKTTSWRLQEFQKRVGEQLFEPMTVSDMKINGHDLMGELNIQPGPILGKIIKVLFEEVMDDTSRNNREYLMSRAKELFETDKGV